MKAKRKAGLRLLILMLAREMIAPRDGERLKLMALECVDLYKILLAVSLSMEQDIVRFVAW